MKKISKDDLRNRMIGRESSSKDAPEKPENETPKPPVPKLPTVPPKKVETQAAKETDQVEAPTKKGEDKALANQAKQNFHLDQAERLPPELFPHQPTGENKGYPATIPNMQFLLRSYGINIKYNVIKKAPEIIVPGLVCSPDNADSAKMVQIKSLARQNGMLVTGLEETIRTIADRNLYNPVAQWIQSEPWDGRDRFPEFYDTLTERDEFPKHVKELLMKRWMISAVAAVFVPEGYRSRGVLTIQGRQSLGKTSWIAALVPDLVLRESVIKLDHHLDAGDKDSKIIAATHWMIEIGELESSFRRDVARLKGFITSDCDKIRLPYARSTSVFPRRSVFAATVNDSKFLVDATGNTRWWVIPVIKINYEHQLDMQQVWAQFKVEFDQEEPWWLIPQEEDLLEMLNRDHRVVSVIEERVMPVLDLSRKGEEGLPAMTPTELLMRIGYKSVSNPQAKECGALLRELLGEPKKLRNSMRWRIPFAKQPDITKIEDDY